MQLFWDADGNLAQMIDCDRNRVRFHRWNDFDRLTFSLGHDFCGYYGYDADGIRTYKLTGTCTINQQNGGDIRAQAIFDDAVLYPSPYMVVTPKGYTNHYYAGSERIASRVGDKCWTITLTDDLEKPAPEFDAYENFMNMKQEDYPFGNEKEISSPTTNVAFDEYYNELVQYSCNPVFLPKVDVLYAENMLEPTIACKQSFQNDAPVYYYHPDHLGSTSWVTNTIGDQHQFLAYLPYGEPLLNVLYDNYDSRYGLIKDVRYKFTGKERDEETGYDYMEQRYYWKDGSFWSRPDPLMDKNIEVSPYAYCNGNPLKFIDPNGEDEWSLDINTGKFQNIGNKGGSTIDYYSVGTYEGEKFSSYSNYEIERGDGTINSFRIQETDKSTISAFHIPETNTSGFILERPGPDTAEQGQSLRIPANQYGLYENQGSQYPGVPRLYLPNEGIGGKFDARGILIHIGNYPDDSKGCLLPGSSWTKDFVGNSGKTLHQITNYVASKNWLVKLNIFNAFK